MLRRAPTTVLLLGLVACGPDYSPDTYAMNAVQQANKVEQGVIVGVRDVAVSANGTIGAVTGGAAGGIAGSQIGVGPVSAFTALGGTLVGGITGSAIEHASGDTKAFEYIVRKTGSELVSVTQKDKAPLVLGQRVLVIAGNQARVVPDYTVGLTSAERAKVADASPADAGLAAPTPGSNLLSVPSGGATDARPSVAHGVASTASGSPETASADTPSPPSGAPTQSSPSGAPIQSPPGGAPIQLAQPAIGAEPPR